MPNPTLENLVDEQLADHRGMNLFSSDSQKHFRFSERISDAMAGFAEVDDHEAMVLIERTTNKTAAEFCRVNQYFTVDLKTQQNLRQTYATLLEELRNWKKVGHGIGIEGIARRHFLRLRRVLRQSNPFAETLYADQSAVLTPIPCHEYSPELQMGILGIDLNDLAEPVLDIGCGKDARLVKFLRLRGIETVGVDRFVDSSPFLTRASWFEFDFEPGRWGTVLSHLSFSNHFQHHHHRRDGDFVQYARTYMKILASLKVGGRFHYAPGLEFMEQYLESRRFVVSRRKLKNGFDATVIERMS